MKLVACQLDVGGLIWVNPDHITSVQRQGPGVTIIRFAAGQPQQMAQVKGEAQDVAMRLMESPDPVVFDRRDGRRRQADTTSDLNFDEPARLETPASYRRE
jgi:hypothetical protein